ncbi:hypothetical protein BKA70DRAFT_1556313 [Coprinopsis sp. MPI-PUGE-AT-0042]|nr:hypothetical protein BKA70DRAFT_1556313 [Coprinopsis sp. MPI-PUGE-AT-0042]
MASSQTSWYTGAISGAIYVNSAPGRNGSYFPYMRPDFASISMDLGSSDSETSRQVRVTFIDECFNKLGPDEAKKWELIGMGCMLSMSTSVLELGTNDDTKLFEAARNGLPALYIYGTADKTLDTIRLKSLYREHFSCLDVHRIEGGSHSPFAHEHVSEVAEAIISHSSSGSGGKSLWIPQYSYEHTSLQGRSRKIRSRLRKCRIELCSFTFFDSQFDDLEASETGAFLTTLREIVQKFSRQLASLQLELEFAPEWLVTQVLGVFTDLEYPKLSKLKVYVADPGEASSLQSDETWQFFITFATHSDTLKEIWVAPAEWLLAYGRDPMKCFTVSQATSFTFEAVESVRSVLSPLRRCAELQELDVRFMDHCDLSGGWLEKEAGYRDGAPLIIDLPKMKTLLIEFSNAAAANTMNALKLPQLQLLTLRWYSGIPRSDREAVYNSVKELVRRSHCLNMTVELSYNGEEKWHTGRWTSSGDQLRRFLLRKEQEEWEL